MTNKPTRKLSLVARLRLLPRYFRDEEVPLWRKSMLVAGLLYILSPVDAVPEIVLPILGWLDDLGILTLLTAWTYKEIGKWNG